MKSRRCELCGGPATLHCASDAAFLCRSCDANVHSANFLVARHVRTPICPTCHRPNHARRFSGAGLVSPSSSCLTSDGTDARVLEAVAAWRSGGGNRREALRRLGVPAKVILAADGRLRGRLRIRHVEKEVEEGWGECGFSPKR